MIIRPVFAALLLAGGLAASPALASTVVLSDNFNTDAQGLNWPGDGVFTSTSPPASVDLIGTGFFDLYPGNGNYVDLDGSSGNGNDPAGQLTSVLSFSPGTYHLSFDLGGNARGAPAQTTQVSLGSFSTSILLGSGAPLAAHSYSFNTATGGQLVFTEHGPSDQQGNILDNVQLTAVPEPASWALMLVGFLGLGSALRKRRAAGSPLPSASPGECWLSEPVGKTANGNGLLENSEKNPPMQGFCCA